LLSVFNPRGRKLLTGQNFSAKSFILSDVFGGQTWVRRIEKVQIFGFGENFFARLRDKTPVARDVWGKSGHAVARTLARFV
jgi:hypothetical protein